MSGRKRSSRLAEVQTTSVADAAAPGGTSARAAELDRSSKLNRWEQLLDATVEAEADSTSDSAPDLLEPPSQIRRQAAGQKPAPAQPTGA